MKKIELIAIDLDGTLLPSENNMDVSKNNIKMLERAIESGIHIAIVTGRNYLSARNVLANTNSAVLKKLPLSLQNGSLLVEGSTNKILKAYDLDKDIAHSIIRDMKKIGVDVMVHDSIKSGVSIFVEDKPLNRAIEIYLKNRIEIIKHDKTVVKVKDLFETLQFNPIQLATIDTESKINTVMSFVNEKYGSLVKTVKTVSYLDNGGWWWFEVFNKKCSKSRGLRDICSIYNIPLENAAYIGDNYNDVEAMRVAGYSVAVNNAPDDIKQMCDLVVSSNNEDGVAEALEKILENCQ